MPLADELIGEHTAKALIRAIAAVTPGAPLTALCAAGCGLATRSLRERAELLRDALLQDVPGDYGAFARTIRDGYFSGWSIWPVTSAIAAKAIDDGSPEAFDDAMGILAELTCRLTSEFAIRPLLNHDLDRALASVMAWTTSPDEDVRRLASEGTRPLLPGAQRVPAVLANPRATVDVINALYRDESEYVRRSVADHLKDLSRRHPDIAIETAAGWLAAPDENTTRLVRRGLIKSGLIKKGALDLG
jgi:3-methyladenine DNA glycosylase AlkC